MTTKMIYRKRLLSETKLINRTLKGKQIGYWENYYFNGNLRFKGNYDNGIAVGDWHYFNEHGSIIEIINYDNN